MTEITRPRYFDMDGNPMSMEEWASEFENSGRQLLTYVGNVQISTVWLGLDHNFGLEGPPLIFETWIEGRVFDEDYGSFDDMYRYSTKEQAITGHEKAIKLVQERLNTNARRDVKPEFRQELSEVSTDG